MTFPLPMRQAALWTVQDSTQKDGMAGWGAVRGWTRCRHGSRLQLRHDHSATASGRSRSRKPKGKCSLVPT